MPPNAAKIWERYHGRSNEPPTTKLRIENEGDQKLNNCSKANPADANGSKNCGTEKEVDARTSASVEPVSVGPSHDEDMTYRSFDWGQDCEKGSHNHCPSYAQQDD